MDAPGAAVTETWHNVPRAPAALANVLNGGAATPVFAGVAAAATGTVSSVPVPGGTSITIGAGARLRVGGRLLRVTADAAAGDEAIAVEPVLATIEDGASVFAIAYDYAGEASSTQVPVNLATGSNLVAVNADGASGKIKPGPATLIGQTAACRWYAPGPGGALSLDGVTGMARAADGGATGVGTDGDFTLESWVKPAGTGGLGRVVASAGAGAHSYTLALRPQPGALHFDGAHDAVIVPPSSALQFSGRITLEAWVQPQATDGFRDIVAHGYRLDVPGEVFLRINGGNYEVGSWDGANHLVSTPVPKGDLGTWVHLAGVWDGSAWRLYRNGVLANSAPSTVGAVSVGAGWAIGSSSTGTDRFFSGGIDEVRIWNYARTPDQVSLGRAARVTGSEPGLVGYWRPQLPDVFHYVDQPGAPASVKGAPTLVAGPFSSYHGDRRRRRAARRVDGQGAGRRLVAPGRRVPPGPWRSARRPGRVPGRGRLRDARPHRRPDDRGGRAARRPGGAAGARRPRHRRRRGRRDALLARRRHRRPARLLVHRQHRRRRSSPIRTERSPRGRSTASR